MIYKRGVSAAASWLAILLVAVVITFTAVPSHGSTTLSVGTEPVDLAVVDLNRDSDLDFVVADYEEDTVYVLLGNGDGTFVDPVGYGVGEDPVAIAVGTINGDAHLDVIVALQSSDNDFSLLLGNGNGTFQPAVNLNFFTVFLPEDLTLGDLNGDDAIDLVVAGNTRAEVLLGNGDGTFQTPVHYIVGGAPDSVALANLDGDDNLDLVVTVGSTDNVAVLLGNGDGTFGAVTTFGAGGEWPDFVAVAHLNGDAHLDLALANFNSGGMAVLMGNGNGTFQAATTYDADLSNPTTVAAGDLNDDGNVDLAVSDSNNDRVVVFLGDGAGDFGNGVLTYPSKQDPVVVAVADLNEDGDLDIASANEDISLLGTTGGVTVTCFRQMSPFDGLETSAPPTFTWTAGDYDVYYFYVSYLLWLEPVGYPNLVFAQQATIPLATNSFTMPASWWEWVAGDTDFNWLVVGYNTTTGAFDYTLFWRVHKAAP